MTEISVLQGKDQIRGVFDLHACRYCDDKITPKTGGVSSLLFLSGMPSIAVGVILNSPKTGDTFTEHCVSCVTTD